MNFLVYLIDNLSVCVMHLGRFAKRKLDEFVFFGNRLQVAYAPHFESLLDTKDKLECRRKEVLGRLNRKFRHFST